MKKIMEKWPRIRIWTGRLVFIISILLLCFLLEGYFLWLGIFGIIAVMLALPVYNLIRNREQFLLSLGTLETKIWGKPLEKDYWKKGELKNTKVKIVWSKK